MTKHDLHREKIVSLQTKLTFLTQRFNRADIEELESIDLEIRDCVQELKHARNELAHKKAYEKMVC